MAYKISDACISCGACAAGCPCEAIVEGDNLPRPGVPEAMNVLLHELRGLALSVKLE